jgi:ferric-dicitrate binding protein FerR (iron transport regulator)
MVYSISKKVSISFGKTKNYFSLFYKKTKKSLRDSRKLNVTIINTNKNRLRLQDKIIITAKLYFGVAKPKEKRQLFNSSDSNQMLREDWDNAEKNAAVSQETNSEQIYNRIKNSTKKQLRISRFMAFIDNYAAAIVLLLLVGGVLSFILLFDSGSYHRPKITEKYAPKGQVISFFLPDGSQVYLNAESRLKFPENFNTESRYAELTGEAYFIIKKNPKKPFRVKTSEIEISVLGTEFNLSAYPESETVETTLKTGCIKLSHSNSETRKNRHIILTPGHKADFYKEKKKFISDKVNTRLYTSWIHGKLIFDDSPLSKIIPILERKYDKEFRAEEDLLEEHRLTMTITDESFEQILQMIEKTTPIIFTSEQKDVYSIKALNDSKKH